MTYKIVIAGSRRFTSADKFIEVMDILDIMIPTLLKDDTDIEVVSGCAKGVDSIGEYWATQRYFAIKRFPADWDTLGRKAGIIRNSQMGEYADAALVIWDGVSTGSKNMIQTMIKLDKPWREVVL